jgi:MFS family permease
VLPRRRDHDAGAGLLGEQGRPWTRLAAPFWLLALINLLVGGMVGLERSVVPALGAEVFGLERGGALAAFVVSFGVAKALVNLVAGLLADRVGRRRVLLIGWLVGVPVPLLLIWAPAWHWVIVANVLLGVNQALTWSMTVNMMVDVAPASHRGFAAGVNEFAGYLGVSLLAFLTGLVAAASGLRPEPFYLGVAVSVVGLALSLAVPETAPTTRPGPIAWVPGTGVPSVLGGATNLKDGLVWLALPLVMGAKGFDLAQVGLVAGTYPLVWAVGQVGFGSLSDRVGRRALVLPGMLLQGAALVFLGGASTLGALLAAAVGLGLGTGMVYPTLIALVADRVPTASRATALGVYRFFRDGGYALGAITAAVGFAALSGALVVAGVAIVLLAVATWRAV